MTEWGVGVDGADTGGLGNGNGWSDGNRARTPDDIEDLRLTSVPVSAAVGAVGETGPPAGLSGMTVV